MCSTNECKDENAWQWLWWRPTSRVPTEYTICPITDMASSQYANSYNSPLPTPPLLYFYNSYKSPSPLNTPLHPQFTQLDNDQTIDEIFTQTESVLFCWQYWLENNGLVNCNILVTILYSLLYNGMFDDAGILVTLIAIVYLVPIQRFLQLCAMMHVMLIFWGSNLAFVPMATPSLFALLVFAFDCQSIWLDLIIQRQNVNICQSCNYLDNSMS